MSRLSTLTISTSFVYLDLVKRRLMCIVLCTETVHCIVCRFTCPLLYPVYFAPQNAWSYFEKKTWYRFCRSFHISCTFIFRTALGNRRTWAFAFVQCLFCENSSALRADFFLHQCNKICRLTSKRLCYSPCSEDSEKDSCSNKIKTTCRHWKRHSRLMKQIISSLQFFSMFSHL